MKIAPGTDDPKRNAEAVKAALYYMGADMVGICELPEYAWYSHDTDGSEIKPYHKYGIAILVDQGYETMEGASGDDWISGAQSMRAYLRAQLIGGVVGAHIRSLGYSARGHSVMDQDVLHIPIILEAGLGELSRIGELVLNPYVGPRFKSGVITTNLPLLPDKPIDFGLQGLLREMYQVCPGVPVPGHSIRRQDHVQRLRNVEAGRGEMRPLPYHQRRRRPVRPLHEDLSLEYRRGIVRKTLPVGGHEPAVYPRVDRQAGRRGGQRP